MMSPAIVILAVSTLVLVISALFIFNSKQAIIENEISIGSSLDEIYIQSEILNFYLDDICSKVKSTANPQGDFASELKKYKNNEGKYIFQDLEQIEEQVNEETVKFNTKEGRLNVKLNILLSKDFGITDNSKSSFVKAAYNYTYSCSKRI